MYLANPQVKTYRCTARCEKRCMRSKHHAPLETLVGGANYSLVCSEFREMPSKDVLYLQIIKALVERRTRVSVSKLDSLDFIGEKRLPILKRLLKQSNVELVE